jgi:hypothetical protein
VWQGQAYRQALRRLVQQLGLLLLQEQQQMEAALFPKLRPCQR